MEGERRGVIGAEATTGRRPETPREHRAVGEETTPGVEVVMGDEGKMPRGVVGVLVPFDVKCWVAGVLSSRE